MRECSQARKKKAPQAPTRVLKKGVRNVELKKKIKSRTSPGPPATATSGLLRGVFGAGARRRAAAAVLLVLQTPRAEGAWRRIERARGGESWTEMKKLEAQRRGGKIVLSPLTRRLVFLVLKKGSCSLLTEEMGPTKRFILLFVPEKEQEDAKKTRERRGGGNPSARKAKRVSFRREARGREEKRRERERENEVVVVVVFFPLSPSFYSFSFTPPSQTPPWPSRPFPPRRSRVR